MIIDFRFGNFRSFRDEQTFSLIAASKLQTDPELDKGNVVRVREKPELSLLRVAAIYGANASGKSNIIKAVEKFCDITIRSANTDFRTRPDPFYFDIDGVYEPTLFEMTILLPTGQYRYGFEYQLSSNHRSLFIKAEWLYQATARIESKLFEREGDNVTIGSKFREGKSLLHDIDKKSNKGRIQRNNALLLSMSAQIGGEIATNFIEFLFKNIRIISGLNDENLLDFTSTLLKAGTYKEDIIRLTRSTDPGITNIIVKDVPENNNFKDNRLQVLTERSLWIPLTDDDGNLVDTVPFDMLRHDSLGTQKMFAYSGAIVDSLRNGHHLFIDEMDARFHPLLTQQIVSLFQSQATNPQNAQLVFVTHDTNQLDPRRLRRDQIWFVEKDRHDFSHLYSLAELKGVRKDSDFADDYLRGRYGAIPFVGGFAHLFEDLGSKEEANAPEDTAGATE